MGETKENILLIQTAFIGDVILTTPLIAAIKRFFPGSRLTVLVKPEARSLLAGNPAVDEVLVIDKRGNHRGLSGMARMAREIRSRKFTLLLSPHKSHRTSLLAALSGISRRFGYRSAGFARLSYTHRLGEHRERPEIHRLLAFLADTGIPDAEQFSDQLLLYESDDSIRQATELLSEPGMERDPPILIAASSVWATKRWTPSGFAELCTLLHHKWNSRILFVGSKGDFDISEEAIALLRKQDPETAAFVHNACGRTNLPGLYSLIKRSRLLVSNDSAPVHFACAARIPLVAIFGPTVPSLGYAPITPESAIAELELECRPCGTHGAKECPLGHFRCMRDLSAAAVMTKVEEVMERAAHVQ